MLLQANDYLWLHDHLGCELQIGGSDQWGNIVSGVDLIRRKRQARGRTPWRGRCSRPPTARSSARRPAPGVARPGQDPPVPVPPALGAARRRRGRAAAACSRCARSPRSTRCWPSTPRRPSGGWPSGRWPTRSRRSCTAEAAARPRPRPPTCCSAAIRWRRRPTRSRPLAGEVPTRRLTPASSATPSTLLVRPGWPSSKSEARRPARSRAASGPTARPSAPTTALDGVALLHDRFLLLRKGKRAYHLVEISSARRLTLRRPRR